jgi:hypothetical protein
MREVSMCDGGRKGSDVFFPAKNLRNAPWEVVVFAVILTEVVIGQDPGCENLAISYLALAHTQRSERPHISRDMSNFHCPLVFKSVATSGKLYCQHGKELCRAVQGGGGGR